MQEAKKSESLRTLWYMLKWMAAAAAAMTLLLYVPTPFAAYEPGIAFPTKPLVKTVQADKPSEGAFMLTTVKLSDANVWKTIRSAWDDNIEIHRKRDILRGNSETAFKERQTILMQGSSVDAIEAAYRQAGIAYQIEPYALMVSEGAKQDEQADRLVTGDEVIEVDEQPVNSLEELRNALSGLLQEETFEMTVKREGRHLQLRLTLNERIAAGHEAEAVGAVQLSELRRMLAMKQNDQVTIESGEIGGPSAGLMFALQALDELTAGDLTGGLQVAGTGTINASGNVGAIGGIAHKVAAADLAGAELFLAPEANVQEAKEKALSIGSDMEVVGVSTISEAVNVMHAKGKNVNTQAARPTT